VLVFHGLVVGEVVVPPETIQEGRCHLDLHRATDDLDVPDLDDGLLFHAGRSYPRCGCCFSAVSG
jgi:hypothetical protein